MRTAHSWDVRPVASGLVPLELVEALARYPAARLYFEGLSAWERRTYAEYVTTAEDRDNRRARAEQALTMLAERAAWAGGASGQAAWGRGFGPDGPPGWC